jgi:hypothetical protein
MHLRIVAVDDDRVTVLGKRHRARRLPDNRNAHGARDDDYMARDGTLFKYQAAHVLARIVEQFGRAHGTRDDDRVVRKVGRRKLGAIAGKLAQEPVGEVVEIVHPFAQVRIRQTDHPCLGLALHPLDRRFRRQAVANRFLELSDPAAVMGEHAIGLKHRPVLALHRHVAPRQHVVDRDPQRTERLRKALQFLIRVLVEQVGDDDPRFVQHHIAKADALAIAVALDGDGPRKIELQSGLGDLLELAGRYHLGEHHGGRLEHLDLVLAVVALRLVLHDENAERAPRAQDRHAEEGVIDLLTGLRQVGEGGMRLRIGEIERPHRRGDRADEALPHLQLRQVHGGLVQTLGRVKLKHAVGAQHIDGAHFRDHVLRDLAHDPVKALLRLERFRHELAQPLEENAWTRRKVSHRVRSPEQNKRRHVTGYRDRHRPRIPNRMPAV